MAKVSNEDLMNILVQHMSATTAAFQCLVHCLEENGALERGEVSEKIRIYMEMVKRDAAPEKLALLHDLRMALMD